MKCSAYDCDLEAEYECDNATPTCRRHKSSCCRAIVLPSTDQAGEINYEYVKGTGWVPQVLNSKTIWVSPDRKFAIAKVTDLPNGTPRSESYSPDLRTMERCIEILKERLSSAGASCLLASETYSYSSNEVALYYRESLPWEI